MKHKLCLIYNTAPRYREAVFRAIDKEYDCDWYFGYTETDIKEMDTKLLNRVRYYRTWGIPQSSIGRGAFSAYYSKRNIRPSLCWQNRAQSQTICSSVWFHCFFLRNVYTSGRTGGMVRKPALWLNLSSGSSRR